MSRIVMVTSGSLGDLRPYVSVGLGLKARGHDIVVATAPSYRAYVEAKGLQFEPVRPPLAPGDYPPDALRRANDLKTGTRVLLREIVLPKSEEMYADLLSACRGADLMVSHTVMFAAPVVAEKLNLRWVLAVLSPGSYTSAYDPPVLPPFPQLHALRHFGPVPNRLLFEFFRRVTRSWMQPIDAIREREGLPRARTNPIQMFSPHGTLAWFSPILGKPQPDWPVRTTVTGFPFSPNGNTLRPELAAFLQRGDPPVIFTLGTSAVLDPGRFYGESLRAVRRLGCRAVFLTGPDRANRPNDPLPDNVFATDYAEYSGLFPRAAAVVHQGGIGTTAEAIRAGVPALVVPYMHDQPDNAFRARRLGIARVVNRAQYNAQRAEHNLRLLLSHPSYKKRATEVAAELRREDGLGRACAAVEEHAANGHRG